MVGLSVETDRPEASPGDEVRYWVRARNLSSIDLDAWKAAFFFDQGQMQILQSSGGKREGDHVTFTVPASRPGEEFSFTVRVRLFKNLRGGQQIRTYGSMIWDGRLMPACAHHDLLIIARIPVTGIGDGTRPVENLRQFLRPMEEERRT